MFSSILCATDFSRGGSHALEVAARWAEAHGAMLEVLNVVTPIFGVVPSSSVLDEIGIALRNDAEQTHENALAKLRPRVRVTGRVVDGIARDRIVEEARASKADLIVVGTSGESTLTRVVLGSTADRVVRTSDGMVLVVPTDAPSTVPRVIVAPTDFSPASHASVRLARELAERFAARVEIVHAYEIPFFADRSRPEIAGLSGTLAARAREVHDLDEDIRVHVVEGTAASAIERIAREVDANLVVMGGGARGTATRWLLGSVTDRVLRTSHAPVLVVHAVSGSSGA
jgi:CPA2 family monovalent cation:H+ antiporter-2